LTKHDILELYFLDARHKLIEIGAFLDRLERAKGPDDFRVCTFRRALEEMSSPKGDRVQRILMTLSDPTAEPIAVASTKSACGAWPGNPSTSGRARRTVNDR
jgi:hypothetical protein